MATPRKGTALVVSDWSETPKGYVKCPAELTKRHIQCVDCCLCFPGVNVVFKEH